MKRTVMEEPGETTDGREKSHQMHQPDSRRCDTMKNEKESREYHEEHSISDWNRPDDFLAHEEKTMEHVPSDAEQHHLAEAGEQTEPGGYRQDRGSAWRSHVAVGVSH